MKCISCSGDTKVVDRRGVRRRRECVVCGKRFSTEEVLAGAVKNLKPEPRTNAPAPRKAEPKKERENTVSAIKKAASARRKIEERRDELFSDSWDDFFDDEDVKKWLS
jgi:transcriptional regulator NrdR family protein